MKNRILILVAFLCELLATAGIGEVGLGSIHFSLLAAGLAAYFLSQVL